MMYLSFRPATPKDFKEGFALIMDRFAYSKSDQARLFSFWRYLLKNRMARSVVVEDRETTSNKRIVGFAISLFLTDEFVHKIKTSNTPPFSRQIFQHWLKGNRVFLNYKEIAFHNSKSDLNLVSLQYGWKKLPEPDLVQVRTKMLETLFLFHAGYRIKEFFLDVFGQEDKTMMQKQGFGTFWDYGQNPKRKENSGFSIPIFLIGANQKNTSSRENQYVWSFLNSPSPRFNFTPGEKDVLEKTFLGETDQETASSLHLSIWAIKKRWQGIYGKVEKMDNLILAPPQEDPNLSEETRKIERRRYLLDYLRNHLEEIRPTLPESRRRTVAKLK